MENTERNEKYELINQVLNEYFLEINGTFFYDYIYNLFSLAAKTREIITENDEALQDDPQIYKLLNPGYDELTAYLSYPETLQIVRNYLQERLPQYVETFENCLNNGIINIVADLEDESVEDKENHAGYKKEENHDYINSALEHNYTDPATLLHEFIHYLNKPQTEDAQAFTRKLLTETISIFFECDILKFMAEKGYDKKELAKVAHHRIENCYTLTGTIQWYLSLLYTFKNIGNLSDKSFEESKQLNLAIRRKTQEDYLEDIDKFYNALKKRTASPHILVGYNIGTVIALGCLEKDDPEMVDKFAILNEAINSKSILDCLDIIGIKLTKSDNINELLTSFKAAVVKVAKELSIEKKDNATKIK